MSDLKAIPEFKSEEEEFEFWSSADSTEYIDWSAARKVRFANLEPSLQTPPVSPPTSSTVKFQRLI